MKYRYTDLRPRSGLSLPVRGAWIEIIKTADACRVRCKSLPVRGAWIEIRRMRLTVCFPSSLPVRGAWIEIPCPIALFLRLMSLPVRGAWIEIRSCCKSGAYPDHGRSPCGERGLKYAFIPPYFFTSASLPVRGAWIEICIILGNAKRIESLPVRGAWIEIGLWLYSISVLKSLPVRGAWIEINMRQIEAEFDTRRSPCGERGLKYLYEKDKTASGCRSPCGERGLKLTRQRVTPPNAKSLPVRGAWIEIQYHTSVVLYNRVAPRAGSVD